MIIKFRPTVIVSALQRLQKTGCQSENPKDTTAHSMNFWRRVAATGWNEYFDKYDPIPNLKTDVNNHGPFSSDNIGMNWDYPDASYERRKEILKEHRLYQKGLLYFMSTDQRIPPEVRIEMNQWGLCRG